MKVKISLTNVVVDVAALDHLDALLRGAEREDYDYNGGDYIYYIRPQSSGPTIEMVPSDIYEAKKLVYELNYKDKK